MYEAWQQNGTLTKGKGLQGMCMGEAVGVGSSCRLGVLAGAVRVGEKWVLTNINESSLLMFELCSFIKRALKTYSSSFI